MVEALESGIENGHHPLGFTPAKGDLRDCTVSEFRSNPQAKFDHRLTWRQLPPQSEGSPPSREIVDVGPRHGTPPFYERQCQILGRTMSQEVQANEVFGITVWFYWTQTAIFLAFAVLLILFRPKAGELAKD